MCPACSSCVMTRWMDRGVFLMRRAMVTLAIQGRRSASHHGSMMCKSTFNWTGVNFSLACPFSSKLGNWVVAEPDDRAGPLVLGPAALFLAGGELDHVVGRGWCRCLFHERNLILAMIQNKCF